MNPKGSVWCYIRVDHLLSSIPYSFFFFVCLFHSVPYFTALLDVLSGYNLSRFLWTAQRPSYKPLSVWSDLFSLFCFFSFSYYRSPTVLHLLFHSILVSTPLLLLCSLCLKMVSMVTVETQLYFEKTSLFFLSVFFFPFVQCFLLVFVNWWPIINYVSVICSVS